MAPASIRQSVTGLCPVDTFDDTPLYASKADEPDDAEIARRREAWWQPYHGQLRAELDRIKSVHGTAMLWDAHSIRSVLPRFFDGKLPDLNLGTADGKSCDPRWPSSCWILPGRLPATPACSTAASRAATSRATMASPSRASTPCSSK